MTRTLITGGTGVLGRQLVPRLLAMGHTVRIASRGPRRGQHAEGEGLPGAVEGVGVSLELLNLSRKVTRKLKS